MTQPPCIALVSTGELGSVLAAALVRSGLEVVAYIGGRSRKTQAAAAAAGCKTCENLLDLVSKADVVISAVPGEQATQVARQIVATGAPVRNGQQIYLDLNSVSPAKIRTIADIVERAGFVCVDGAVVGQAAKLVISSQLLLSGSRAQQVASYMPRRIKIRVVGTGVGDASGIKLSMSILSKGLVALYLETIAVADSAGHAKTVGELIRASYPNIVERVEQQLVSYPAHVARRQHELKELAKWAKTMHVDTSMADGTLGAFDVLKAVRVGGKEHRTPDAVVAAFCEAAKLSGRFVK